MPDYGPVRKAAFRRVEQREREVASSLYQRCWLPIGIFDGTMPKRKSRDDYDDIDDGTPKKARLSVQNNVTDSFSETDGTPTRKSALRTTPSKASIDEETPRSSRRVLFTSTADGLRAEGNTLSTPLARRHERSARKKSTWALQRVTALEDVSEAEDDDGEIALAHDILQGDEQQNEVVSALGSPSKQNLYSSRPRGKRRELENSPPPDLPPHETFFFQNRTGANKTSTNILPANLLLNHDEYRENISSFRDSHQRDAERLQEYHKHAFDQWVFELEEDFNLCLYGYGSKRALLMEFVDHLYWASKSSAKILVVNGYTPGLSFRDIIAMFASQILPKSTKLSAQPSAALDTLLAALDQKPAEQIVLVLHSMDHASLRSSQPYL